MSEQHPLYSAILPTILCQQPAVILHWLNEQRATGNLPVEIVLDVLIELVSRQISPTEQVKPLETTSLVTQLEVYKRAVKTCRLFVPGRIGKRKYVGKERQAAYDALDAVDKLEGVE